MSLFRKLYFVTLVIIVTIAGCKTESDQEIFKRLSIRQQELKSLQGAEIEFVSEEKYRETIISLKDGRKIIVKSGKRSHELYIVK